VLRLNLNPSRLCLYYLTLGYAIGAICVILVPLSLWLKSLLLCTLLLNFLFVVMHQVRRSLPSSIVAMQFDRDGVVLMQQRDGTMLTVRVLASSFVAPYLSIVLFKPHQAWFARSVVLLPDMLSQELFRHLRVWLQWRLGRGELPQANIEWTGQL
jgi:toxin CptA